MSHFDLNGTIRFARTATERDSILTLLSLHSLAEQKH